MKDKQIGILLGGLAVLFLFTYFGFLNPQECDVDRIYLSCRLDPFTLGDLFGCILFYGGTLFLCGITRLFGFELYNAPHSDAWTIGSVVGIVLGIVLIWNT